MAKRTPIHPGEIIADELEVRPGLGAERRQLEHFIASGRAIDATTARMLSDHLGPSPEFWLNLQAAYDRDAAAA